MSLDEFKSILIILEQHQPKGVGIFSLSKKTNIDANRLRKFLQGHDEYFVSLPESQTYGLNRFGQFKGITESMINHYQDELKSSYKYHSSLYFLVFAAVFVCFVAVISNAT